MELQRLPDALSVCKLSDIRDAPPPGTGGFYSLTMTDGEISLVCRTSLVPPKAPARSDGWTAFRVCGVLDFSLVGILAGRSAVLAARK